MANPKTPADPFDLTLVRALAEVLDETGLSEIELDRGGTRIRVARHAPGAGMTMVGVPTGPGAPALPASPGRAAGTGGEAETTRGGEIVRSPMVGTVYFQPQPGAEPFAKPGDLVSEGQTLLLVEAMKTMNPITAPRTGRVAEFLVSDGQPVEYGEPLVVLE
ncbi:MAG: acetyl-CoA carboxylase biotin carboxyl carrier protein [Caulobacteraceae bacterium]